MDTNVILTYRRSTLRELPVYQLKRGRYQPRQVFSAEQLEALAQTIRQLGVIEPLVVRPLPDQVDTYEIIAGERRWRAAQHIGLDTVPCMVAQYSDEQAAQIAFVENTHREALDPLSQAQALQRLLSEFHYTHEALAGILGLSREKVSHQLRLLKLDARLQAWLQSGDLSEGHGKVLAGVPIEQQYRLGYMTIQQGWSVHKLMKTVQALKKPKASAGQPIANNNSDTMRVERQLSDRLGYPVKLALVNQQAGFLKIEFANFEHLQGLLEKLGYEAD